MKIQRLYDTFLKATFILLSLLALISCSMIYDSNSPAEPYSDTVPDFASDPSKSDGMIYLYGEYHAVEEILDIELERWNDYYHNEGMRHLFVELPYYTGELMNLWMQADNNDIFEAIYDDWTGASFHSPLVKDFFENIKIQCPDTIFHGTDVGHQHSTTGQRYLNYLEDNNLESSHDYDLTLEAIEQGRHYSTTGDAVYRENKMVENFVREFDSLTSEDIMGIYGATHTEIDSLNYSGEVLCMTTQLIVRYGDNIIAYDLR